MIYRNFRLLCISETFQRKFVHFFKYEEIKLGIEVS